MLLENNWRDDHRDIAGSFSCLVILSPVFLTIVLGIKLTSKGPVLFKQDRLGQWGKTFTSLKFRSMYVSNDDSSPKEYVTKFIAQGNGTLPAEGRKRGEVVYNIRWPVTDGLPPWGISCGRRAWTSFPN